jgi:asparagine synthase (glutamine-hydrolysing)
MCGIVGFWDQEHLSTSDESRRLIARMTDAISHRGPDDEGHWQDEEAGLTFGFRRLAIIDVSSLGHQPMLSASGRFVIVFNGEIYNYDKIRQELEAHASPPWRGRSDTEVLLAAIEQWGVEAALTRANGQFAIALWDRRERTLTLARDRMGEKPLYYGWLNGTLVFGSEPKALKLHPNWSQGIDASAVAAYVRYGYVPAPMSIWEGIRKLRPAHYLQIGPGTPAESFADPVCYWSHEQAAVRGLANPLDVGDRELLDLVQKQVNESVRSRMGADVPLGAFLSGGIDSSLVAALMQENSSKPVHTFSIGFWEKKLDEAPFAAAVAKHLGTEHEEFYVTADEALSVIPKVPRMYDEPFGDASQIPTYLLSALASRKVKVALSGDGGDELFFGYERYFRAMGMWKYCRLLPQPLRASLARGVNLVPRKSWDRLMTLLPCEGRTARFGYRVHKFAEIVAAPTDSALYALLISHARDVGQVLRDAPALPDFGAYSDAIAAHSDMPDRMMLIDQLTYLPDDILTKVDRASMAASLECRAPYVDHDLLELAWRIPARKRYADGQGKWPLRRILARYVPLELTDRPKKGFGIPIAEWLGGPLRAWAGELLSGKRLNEQGFFFSQPILEDLQDTLSGSRDCSQHLWNILMFQAWLEEETSRADRTPERSGGSSNLGEKGGCRASCCN